MNRVLVLILAGGAGHRLSILAEERAKPAVPFAGKYRIIDFTLSKCVHSGISRVGVLTQYRPHSLNKHIGLGAPWGLDRDPGGITLLQPHTGRRFRTWYKGTADAVYQNLSFVEENRAQQVLILAGDHVYRMRYDNMLAFHQAKGADATLGVFEVPLDEASRFGLVALNEDEAVVDFEEKPSRPKSRLASMGIYVFSYDVLREVLEEDARKHGSTHDFGRDIVPAMLGRYRVFAYRFSGYWRDVGTVGSYWQANMEFLEDPPPLNLDSVDERILTRSQDRPPAEIGPKATVWQTLLCHGCKIRSAVHHSVLSQGVLVEEGARVEDSILFDDVVVRSGARVHRSVLDKEVVVSEDAVVGYGDDNTPNRDEPQTLYAGIALIGKRAVVPAGVRIGRNCKIMPGVTEKDFLSAKVSPSGSTIEAEIRPPFQIRLPAT